MELRWDPILGEWVMVSSVRRARPWLPSGYCPFCPGAPETGYGWSVLVLENRYPMLSPNPPEPSKHRFYRTGRALGRCMIVVETPEHDVDDISDLPIGQIKIVLKSIRGVIVEESGKDYASYLLWFRNKGVEIGVSLTHPHSQIYITPFIPVKIKRELRNFKRYSRRTGRCPLCDIINVEEEDKARLLQSTPTWIAFMPFHPHWPFEAFLAPRRHIGLLTELNDKELEDLALMLKLVLCGFKNLFRKPTPYMLVLHQAPLKGDHDYYHLHLEIYGVEREEGKMKFAAGMENGGGNFTYDAIPEENAEALRGSIENCKAEFQGYA
jgi:galactose-1-phosphate uridylyltransferase, family 1